MEKFKKFAARRKWKVSVLFISQTSGKTRTLTQSLITSLKHYTLKAPKTPPQMLSLHLLQHRHSKHIFCQLRFSGRLLVCFGPSRLTQLCLLACKESRDCLSAVFWRSCHAMSPSSCSRAPHWKLLAFSGTGYSTLSLFPSTRKTDNQNMTKHRYKHCCLSEI